MFYGGWTSRKLTQLTVQQDKLFPSPALRLIRAQIEFYELKGFQ